jgi:hypothetical protein
MALRQILFQSLRLQSAGKAPWRFSRVSCRLCRKMSRNDVQAAVLQRSVEEVPKPPLLTLHASRQLAPLPSNRDISAAKSARNCKASDASSLGSRRHITRHRQTAATGFARSVFKSMPVSLLVHGTAPGMALRPAICEHAETTGCAEWPQIGASDNSGPGGPGIGWPQWHCDLHCERVFTACEHCCWQSAWHLVWMRNSHSASIVCD